MSSFLSIGKAITAEGGRAPPPPGSRPGLLARGCLFYSPSSLRPPPPILGSPPLLSCQLSITGSPPHHRHHPVVVFSLLIEKSGVTPFIPTFVPLIISPHPRRSSQAWGGTPGGRGGDSTCVLRRTQLPLEQCAVVNIFENYYQ